MSLRAAQWAAAALLAAVAHSVAGPEDSTPAPLGLAGYMLAAGPIVIAGVEDNASGLAWCPESRTLFLVLNKPTRLVELDRDGQPLRTVELSGFDDTEDVTVVARARLAVVEERRRILAVFDLPAGRGGSVSYARAERYEIDPVPADNSGMEGLCYDAPGKRFLVLKEKAPRRIYAVVPPAARSGRPVITHPWDLEANGFGCSDVSAIARDPRSGNLLILSDESKVIVECTPDGGEVARLSLAAGSAGLAAPLKQPEGLALADDGTLYVCSEPNQLYVFRKP